MQKSISILGCGWLGMPLAKDLSKIGYLVKGSNTSGKNIEELKSSGISPFIIDISKRDNDFSDFLASDVLLIAITSKNIDDYHYLVSNIENSEIKLVIFISSTSVYPEINDIVTEETPIKDTPLAYIESLFIKNKSFDSVIIRFGGLFGGNRKPGNFFREGRVIDNPEGFINLIHRDDCIKIIEQIIEKDIKNEVFNGVTDSHPKRREFYTKEIKNTGNPSPTFNENSVNSYKIVSNEKLKKVLDYKFIYPDLMNY